MTSSVFYKFKSQKETSRVEFDGTGISVFELKRDIIIKSGLGDGTDFDLAIFHEDGKEEYDDDTAVIPRSTTVIARRTPAAKRGAGRAQRYMTGKMPVNAKNSSRKEQANKSAAAKTTSSAMAAMDSRMTEDQRTQAMFAAQTEQWSANADEMAGQKKIVSQFHKKTSDNVPPEGYICYRCGDKGHWIKECPTNDDPNWDSRGRIKRTTGIPKSFLRTVEKPTATSGDDGDGTKPPSGVMVTQDGQFVVAVTDNKSWEQFQAKTKSSAAAQEAAALGNKELQELGLECSIDNRLFIDPMKTPCCEKTYCNDCITNALIESDFTCPNCQTEGVLIDNLQADDEASAKITKYLEEKSTAAKAEKERSKSPSVKPEVATPDTKAKSQSPTSKASPTSNIKSPSKSPQPVKSVPAAPTGPTTANPKKRPADELLENPKIPKGPKAMQQQEAQKQAMLQQQQMMNGFPNMPFMPNMMPNFGMGNMNGFGMNPMGFNPMMNPMMMNSGYGMGGMPNMNMMNGFGMGMMNGSGMGGNMGGNGQQNGNMGGNMNGGGGAANGFPNQQKTIFAEPLPNEEDNAYFRQPVNPHRHQGRQRRARPSDYREL